MIKIAPSILSADFSRLGQEIAAVEAAGAAQIHVDVMDGHFVPNLTIGPPVIRWIRKVTHLPLDVHLMVEDPDRSLVEYREAGADVLTVHVEACRHLHRTLQRIREIGARAGVAVNPATPVSSLECVLDDVDVVLVMSVNPGFGGQRFIQASYQKLRELDQLLGPRQVDRSVDGGVKIENCRALAEAGATTLVAGSAIFEASDPAEVIRQMRSRVHDLGEGRC